MSYGSLSDYGDRCRRGSERYQVLNVTPVMVRKHGPIHSVSSASLPDVFPDARHHQDIEVLAQRYQEDEGEDRDERASEPGLLCPWKRRTQAGRAGGQRPGARSR